MFVNTHVYFAQKVNKSNLSDLATVGSFLPDAALVKLFSWDDLHNAKIINEFKKFINEINPKYLDLAEGIGYHFLLDETTHHHYKDGTGYAYQLITPELIELVAKGFLIKEENIARTISHNIIEIAVDNFVLEMHPELLSDAKNATENVDITEISRLIGLFFKSDPKEVKPALEKFFKVMTNYDTRQIEECIRLCEELSQLLFGNHIKEAQVNQAVLLARELVKDTYQEFLESSISVSKI